MEQHVKGKEAPPEEAEMLWLATYLLMGLKYQRAAIEQFLKGCCN